MNIQIGENTYNNNKINHNDMDRYTYSKESISKNSFGKAAGRAADNAMDSFGVSLTAGAPYAVPATEKVATESIVNIPDATLQKNYMVVMSNTMSDEDFAKLEKEGYHPGDMEAGEMVTIVDRIKTTMAESGQVVAGYNDDLDPEILEKITGSQVYAEAIASAFSDAGIPLTEENISDTVSALDMAGKLAPLDNSTIKYMVAEGMSPTIENIYKAQHSGARVNPQKTEYYMDKSGYLNKSADSKDVDQLEATMKNIVASAGYELSEDNMNMAKDIVASGIALSQKALDIYSALRDMKLPADSSEVLGHIVAGIEDGRRPMEADLSTDESLYDKASRLVDAVENITDEEIEQVVHSDQPLTIRSLTEGEETEVSQAMPAPEAEQAILSAKRLVAEIRLSMTVSSTYVLLKNNISVDTTELNKLVDELKEAENRQFESVFGKRFEADKSSISQLFEETNTKLSELKDMPVAVIGRFTTRSSFSLNVVYSEASELQAKYVAAGQEYEKMFTEVRSDLGDSIRKAFRNASDILEEMGIEASGDNEKAVRILGYNQMEITEASIDVVKASLKKVENVIEKMRPQNVLNLIREGINPLETDMDELDRRLSDMDTVSEPERFSAFLNKLDNTGGITEDERQAYIGIYRMIHSIEKNDSAAVGTLINSRAEINFKNLLSAVRSRKHEGIDITIDDNNGELEQLINKGISISEQISKGYKRPADEYEYIRQAGTVGQEIQDYLESQGIRKTVDNMLMTRELINGSKLYKDIKKNIKKASIPEFNEIVSKTLDSFTDKESAQSAYDDMTKRLGELINEESVSITDTINLKEMSFAMKQLFVATKFSRDEYYEVPMTIDDEVSKVSVRITHGEEKGVKIAFENENYGKVSGKFIPGADGYMGLFQTDGMGIASISDMEETLLGAFESQSLSVSSITFADSSRVNLNILTEQVDNYSNEDVEIATSDLYKLAKTFIETLSR